MLAYGDLGCCRIPLSLLGSKTIVVQIEFNCSFLSGIHYNTCDVRAQISGIAKILHRVIDATMMQVNVEPDLTSVGYVDISTTVRAFPAWIQPGFEFSGMLKFILRGDTRCSINRPDQSSK
jgi:hypothetical protein